jgi:uncharacterized membrane protein
MKIGGTKNNRVSIQDVSAWILRAGVILSVTVMTAGMAISALHNRVNVERIQHSTFDYQPDVIWKGLLEGRGKAVIELGIYILIFTPIFRVFASMLLFIIEERDWLYSLITLVVLVLTLAGLFIVK